MRKIVGILVAVVLAAVTAVLLFPQVFRLERTFPVAQIIAVRGSLLVVFLVIAVLAALLLLRRSLRGFAAAILVIAVIGAGSIAVTSANRGLSIGSLPDRTDSAIRVLTWNTAGAEVAAADIAAEIVEHEVDIVALPETAQSVGEDIAIMLRDQGHPMWVHHVQFNDEVENGPQAWETTVLISTRLGDYSVIASSVDGTSNTGSVPSAVVMPVDGQGPTVVAVHAVAPRKDSLADWESDLRWIADQCPSGSNTILAGDFNATLDHMSTLGVDGGDMGACRDIASRTGTGAMGTWPASVPGVLGAPIDHVMASSQWQASGSLLIEGGDSDHRGLVVQLEPTP